MRSLFLRCSTALVVAVAIAVAAVLPGPSTSEAEAVGAGDVLGAYALRLKGEGFDRDAQSLRVREQGFSGRGVMTLRQFSNDADPRIVECEIQLDDRLSNSALGRITPTPDFRGTGLLVGDSLTVIGAGQENFVSAISLRFRKSGKKVAGMWVISFPGSNLDSGYIAGAGASLRGKRIKKIAPIQPVDVGASTFDR